MSEETVDVLIVGSGHSGGMAAKILTEKGISCLMLNAGPVAEVHKDTEVKPVYALPFRGFSRSRGDRTPVTPLGTIQVRRAQHRCGTGREQTLFRISCSRTSRAGISRNGTSRRKAAA